MKEFMARQTGMMNILIKVNERLKVEQAMVGGEIQLIDSREEFVLFDTSLADEAIRGRLVRSFTLFNLSQISLYIITPITTKLFIIQLLFT